MELLNVEVAGMSCDHCVAAVREEVQGIPGVQQVDITLREDAASIVTITSEEVLDLAQVAAAIDEAGYRMVS